MTNNGSEHIVTAYEEELTDLASDISKMGGMVENAILQAVEALLKHDKKLAKKISKGDRFIGDMQRQIDNKAVSMIARRQPMASDLRLIISSIHVANDLERIGDMAKNIARRVKHIGGERLAPSFYSGIRHMTQLTLEQVKNALDAFMARDEKAAIAICERDDEVDALYISLFRELLTYMMEDPRTITQCTNLLFCGKNLERVGDHATNIAEAAYYLKTGGNLPTLLEEMRQQEED